MDVCPFCKIQFNWNTKEYCNKIFSTVCCCFWLLRKCYGEKIFYSNYEKTNGKWLEYSGIHIDRPQFIPEKIICCNCEQHIVFKKSLEACYDISQGQCKCSSYLFKNCTKELFRMLYGKWVLV